MESDVLGIMRQSEADDVAYVDGMGTVPVRALWRSTDLEQCPLVSVEDPLSRSQDSLTILEPGPGGNWASGSVATPPFT